MPLHIAEVRVADVGWLFLRVEFGLFRPGLTPGLLLLLAPLAVLAAADGVFHSGEGVDGDGGGH